jgi:hypothetical protein
VKDEFTNRSGAFQTALTTLMSDKFKPVWFQKEPAVFTLKVQQASDAVASLVKFCGEQETATSGATQQKANEAAQAEDDAFQMMNALAEWFGDQKDQTNAAKVTMSRSALHGLRDQSLKDQFNLTLSLAQAIVNGSQAAAAAPYGITASNVQSLGQDIAEFGGVLTAPQASIADRKAHTGTMRAQFNAVEAKFVSLDRLIL